jgi:hypothetical protein
MPKIYEIEQYNAYRIIKDEQFDTAKEAYKLLTKKELIDPHCVYENIDKKDNYKFKGFYNKNEWMKKIEVIEVIDDEYVPLICVKIRINVDTGLKKILDYWFE